MLYPKAREVLSKLLKNFDASDLYLQIKNAYFSRRSLPPSAVINEMKTSL